jgi:hypothetical protein
MRRHDSENAGGERKSDQGRSPTVVALVSVLGASLGMSWPASAQDAQKQQMERWKIMQDTKTSKTKSLSNTGGPQQGTSGPLKGKSAR